MAATDFELKRNDTSTRTFILFNPDGSRFDLTGYAPADLAFFFQLQSLDDAGAKVTGVGVFAIVGDPTEAVVTYAFAAADTATAGVYRGEIEALLGAVRNTFPQDEWFTFEITRDLGDLP